MRKYLVIIAILLISISFADAQKYVFLFIGDGMGQADIDLYEAFLAEKDGKDGFVQSSISKIPLLSMCSTVCKNRRITDSGAAGSAIACGQKFNVGEISYSEEGSQPKSIAKFAKEKGMKVGIVTTTPSPVTLVKTPTLHTFPGSHATSLSSLATTSSAP